VWKFVEPGKRKLLLIKFYRIHRDQQVQLHHSDLVKVKFFTSDCSRFLQPLDISIANLMKHQLRNSWVLNFSTENSKITKKILLRESNKYGKESKTECASCLQESDSFTSNATREYENRIGSNLNNLRRNSLASKTSNRRHEIHNL